MQGATHFIEQYRHSIIDAVTETRQNAPTEMKYLKSSLKETKKYNLKTIAVWKIKYKTQIKP